MTRRAWLVVGALFAGVFFLYLRGCPTDDGWPAHDGKIRQTVAVEVGGLRRGAEGTITITATGHYTPKAADSEETGLVRRFKSLTLTLVDAKHASTPLPVKKWETARGHTSGALKLPDVPDGDYQLHVAYKTQLGAGELDVPLALYTPARVHVLTDRPLYEPGNVVRFRAVVLRARDLAPLDGRPGHWVVKDPSGEVLLEEKAAAGDWGVVSGSFPLDKGAATGEWRVAWVSNDASDEVPITVEPFTLPRFRVEASAPRPYYRPHDKPTIDGTVTYSSGAPVANAQIAITWSFSGDWPPPSEWQDKLLPKTAVTGDNGRFELTLPEIPYDLQGVNTMTAQLSAIDAAGDRVEGSASVLLSEDGIQVSAVTEIGDGLVDGFNNRVYLRVTTPDGKVVSGTKVNVKRAWQGNDPGIDADLDEDGVASLQFDPGAPVNVIIPARPWRPQPLPPAVSRGDVEDLMGGEGASLADQTAMDAWIAALSPCAIWAGGDSNEVKVALRVDGGGGITAAAGGDSRLDRCTARVLATRRLPGGKPRLYGVSFDYTDPSLPTLSASVETSLTAPEGFEAAVADLAQGARDCLPRTAEGQLPRLLTWQAHAGEKAVTLGGWLDDPQSDRSGASAMPCVAGRLLGGRVPLDTAVASDAIGIVRFSVEGDSGTSEDERPQPTTMLGYEMVVSADVEGKQSTKLRLGPGTVPELRMRVTPVLAKPGDVVTAELIRGPNYAGTLPDELTLDHLHGQLKAKLGKDHHAQFTIEPGTEGWCQVQGGGARALVYVRPAGDLAVAVKPQQPTYKPGDQAQLEITTEIGGKGGQAAVGLFGVDESLGQLVTLPGPDEMGRVRPQVGTSSPAFGALDGQALTLGRIRGANAAAATVLRVTNIPTPPELDAVVSSSAATSFDPIEELTDHFYVVLAELHVQAREWEAHAPPGELMTPATMVKLWNQALAACQKRGEPITDAYGRKLKLSRLPADLLALTDPREVVVVGTRLPEDVENWTAWVAKEKP